MGVNQKTPIRNSLKRLIRPILLGLVLALALPVPEAFADSLREVAERVARQHDAKKVISARVVERGGRKFYVIRILTQDDVIKTIRVPADDRQYLADSVRAVADRDRTPGSVANRNLLPQQANKAGGAVSDCDLAPGNTADWNPILQRDAAIRTWT